MKKEDLERLFARALKEDRRLEIVYESNNVFTQRRIKVIELKENTVTAYCYLRRQKRSFKWEQILSAQIVFEEKRGSQNGRQ